MPSQVWRDGIAPFCPNDGETIFIVMTISSFPRRSALTGMGSRGVERIILHAGTPKTGTKSLQSFLDGHRAQLLEQGFLYPETKKPAINPRHQWVVGALTSPTADKLTEKLDFTLTEATVDTDTLILSTEGLYNHWWDFSKAGRKALQSLGERYHVEMWTWFRSPVSYTTSNYIEMLKSPQGGFVPIYGRDLSPEEMLEDPWFARHLDYIGFIRDGDRLLGPGSVVPVKYVGDTVEAFLQRLGVEEMDHGSVYDHPTMGDVGVALIRTLNRRNLRPVVKLKAMELVTAIDDLVGDQSHAFELEPATRARVLALAAESLTCLDKEYGITFELESP